MLKNILLLMCCLTMTSCKDDSSVKQPDSQPEKSSIEDSIKKLEDEGKVPQLDRTDTLLGKDLNNNGIRDDIEKYIESRPITFMQKEASMFNAKLFQGILLTDTNDDKALRKNSQDMAASINCLVTRFDNIDDAISIVSSLESKTYNTKVRTMQYIRYNEAQSGSVTELPSGDTCESNQ